MGKVLILASGGLDSTVVIALYKNLGYDVHLLYLPYGNINQEAEMRKLAGIREKFDIEEDNFHTIPVNLSHSNSSSMKEDGGVLYVEMRNLIFISYAISLAETLDIDEIAVGFIQALEPYRDATLDFVLRINDLAVNTSGIEIKAPLINLDKTGVYLLGEKLGVRLLDTFSCGRSATKPCGDCYDCIDTKQLIKQCYIPDEDNPFKN